ncbi:MAG: hypothetical protein HKO68_20995 [Desulfobacterales bacterium]|nr:hypothetical protein [Desulfobacterales bacterium]
MSFLGLFYNGESRKFVDYNLKFIGFTVVLCFFLTFISAQPASAQTIAVDPTSFDYSAIFVGNSSASQIFVIRNTGKGERRVIGIALTDTSNYSLNLNAGGASACGSTTPKIKKDSNCTVGVTFNPTEIGILDAILKVTSDDKDVNQFDADLTGRGITAGDTDADGMSDGWEQWIIDANPNDDINTIEDVLPDDDFDDDGVSNLNEFINGSNPINSRPDTAVLLLPVDGMTEVTLTPQLETEAFGDPEADGHFLTRWQISTDPNFADEGQLVLDLESDMYLTSIVVPDLVLYLNTEYFWRAAFSDSAGQISAWPDMPFSFTTVDVDESDSNLNGIPDNQEVACSVLFGKEEVPANTICINSAMGDGLLGLEGSTNVSSIEAYRSVDPADITDELSGFELELGLMSFKAVCDDVGDTIEVIYHLSETIPTSSRLFKWHPIDGWREHVNAEFLPDGKSVLVRITDGGNGDLDNVANGVVIDPSGVGTQLSAGGVAPIGGGGDDKYNFTCFITTARIETSITRDLFALILVLGCGIFILHKIRKRPLRL